MKRMLMGAMATLAATAAFAAPAGAQIQDQVAINAPCSKPVVECVRDVGVAAVNFVVDSVYIVPDAIGNVCDRVFGPGSCGF